MPKQYVHNDRLMHMRDLEPGDTYITNWRAVNSIGAESFETDIGLLDPFFFSDEVARGRGLKGRVVTGIYTFGLMMGLLGQSGLIRGGMFIGTNHMKFTFPVFPGDRIKAEVQKLQTKKTSKGDREIITYHWVVKNQDDRVVAEGENN